MAWARYERREREKRESESVVDGAAVPSRVFSTIRLKRKFERGYRARVCVVKAVRNRADFTSYRAVIVVRKAESFELQEVGAIAAEDRGLNETDNETENGPVTPPRFTCPSIRLTTMRGSREFSRIGTRVTFPLTLRVKGRANIWNKSTRRRGKD